MKPYEQSAAIALELLRGVVADFMEERGMSQYALAKATGLPKSTIHRFFLKDHDPKMSTLLQIIGAMDTRIYLVPEEMDGIMKELNDEP